MEINRNNIIELVNEFMVKPDKDYGQNFLIDPNICKRIVDSIDINEGEKILEVGPGLGSLTHFFIDKKCEYQGIDIDKRMIEFLEFNYKYDHISFVLNDIRKQDISSHDKIIGNLPYNITTETIVYLLINAKKCSKMVLMCQSETLSHFIDTKGKEYGPVSILIHLLGEIKSLFVVKPGSFYPSPKCNSTVFEIELNSKNNREIALETYSLCKKLFINRRKTIQNNLNAFLKDKDKTIKVLNELGIPLTSRPEEIDYNSYLKLCLLLKTI